MCGSIPQPRIRKLDSLRVIDKEGFRLCPNMYALSLRTDLNYELLNALDNAVLENFKSHYR